MFCQECGKVIPDGAKHCSFCGAPIPASGPRHARPESDDEIYSYSDRHLSDDKDSTKIFDPEHDELDETKVYNFAAFEDNGQDYGGDYDNDYDPRYDPGYDPDYDPAYGPEPIGDDYENYMDGESDETFMDKIDNRFRRDDYDDYDDYDDRRRPKKSKAWIWILISVIVVILIAVILVFAFSGKLFGNKNTAPTTAQATTLATKKPKETTAPQVTDAPAPTEAPETEPPATQAPAPTQAPATDPPATEPPATDPPATDPPTESGTVVADIP